MTAKEEGVERPPKPAKTSGYRRSGGGLGDRARRGGGGGFKPQTSGFRQEVDGVAGVAMWRGGGGCAPACLPRRSEARRHASDAGEMGALGER
jgi:hypothetical protein